MTASGIFTVSLDFELAWGLLALDPIKTYGENLRGTREAIRRVLALFKRFKIHATWASVGLLFADSAHEARAALPKIVPIGINKRPYLYLDKHETLDPVYYFAPELLKEIASYPYQEIGTHTFLHYFCMEEGSSIETFSADIEAAVKIAAKKGFKIRSMVFPKNQWDEAFLPVLERAGILSYRGNEAGYLHSSASASGENVVKKAFRLLDCYIPLTGHNTYPLALLQKEIPYNIPSSRFLRPIPSIFPWFEGLRKRRVIRALRYAATNNHIFHLWFHPHNFGANTDAHIEFLADILSAFSDLRSRLGMVSLNMGEIGDLRAESKEVSC